MNTLPDAPFEPRRPAPVRDLRLVLEGVYDPCDGYGASTQDLVLALGDCGLPFAFVPTRRDNAAIADPRLDGFVREQGEDLRGATSYVLYHTPMETPSLRCMAGASRAIFTMFETTRLPGDWPPFIDRHFDRVIVPSTFCEEVFRDSGVRSPIAVVPLGVSPKRWPFLDRSGRDKPFEILLLANAEWDNPRKNYGLALMAFQRAFGQRRDVRLLLKISGGRSKISGDLPPNVEIIEGRLPQAEVLALMHRADCFLFPSSGEGYGAPPREAMATGLPVIVTRWSALTDICLPGIARWVEPARLRDAHLDPILWPANGGSSRFGQFAEIRVTDLAAVMLDVAENRARAIETGRAAAAWIRETSTYAHTAHRFVQALGLDR